MINNFEQIKTLLKFENPDEFYFVQILQRTKEVPNLGKNNNLIRTYQIYSLEYLEKKKEEMITIATALNARIYIHLNRRSFKMLAFEMLEDIAHQMKSGQFQTISHSYDSICGKHHSEKDKTWIIDADEEYKDLGYEMIEILKTIEPLGDKLIAEIPTKNGWHLITKPFNSQKFGEIYPHCQLHKNNPTVLYIP